jgi:hypothetical protein
MYNITQYYLHAQCLSTSPHNSNPTSRLLLEITPRFSRRMRLNMIIKLLARELALADFSLVPMRRNAMLLNCIAMAIFDGLGGFVPVIE